MNPVSGSSPDISKRYLELTKIKKISTEILQPNLKDVLNYLKKNCETLLLNHVSGSSPAISKRYLELSEKKNCETLLLKCHELNHVGGCSTANCSPELSFLYDKNTNKNGIQ